MEFLLFGLKLNNPKSDYLLLIYFIKRGISAPFFLFLAAHCTSIKIICCNLKFNI